MMERTAEPLDTISTVTYEIVSQETMDDDSQRYTRCRPVAKNYPGGLKTSYEYDDGEYTIRVTDPAGRTTTWVLDPMPRLVEVIDGATGSISHLAGSDLLTLDNQTLRLLAVVDYQGRRTTYAYEDATHQIRIGESDGHTSVFFDIPGRRLMPVLDPEAGVIGHAYETIRSVTISIYELGSHDSVHRLFGQRKSRPMRD